MTRGPKRSIERDLVSKMPAGSVFYTDRPDRTITMFSVIEGRKVKTERGCFMSGHASELKTSYLLKVTILE